MVGRGPRGGSRPEQLQACGVPSGQPPPLTVTHRPWRVPRGTHSVAQPGLGLGGAGYGRGRAGAALSCLVHYLTIRQLAIWLVRYADDGWATAQDPLFEMSSMFHLFLWVVLGTP